MRTPSKALGDFSDMKGFVYNLELVTINLMLIANFWTINDYLKVNFN